MVATVKRVRSFRRRAFRRARCAAAGARPACEFSRSGRPSISISSSRRQISPCSSSTDVEAGRRSRSRAAAGAGVGAVAHVDLSMLPAPKCARGGNAGGLEQAGEVRQRLVELGGEVVVMMRDVADDRRRSGNV